MQSALGEAKSAVFVASACHEKMVSLANDLDVMPVLARSNEILALKTHAVEQAKRAVECAMHSTSTR